MLITGSMGSGKSTTAIIEYYKLKTFNEKVITFTPKMDIRKFKHRASSPIINEEPELVLSKEEEKMKELVEDLGVSIQQINTRIPGLAIPVYALDNSKQSLEVLARVNAEFNPYAVIFMETQLFDSYILDVEKTLAKTNCYVRIYEGLEYNFRGENFTFSDFKASINDLVMLINDKNVIRRIATCEVCGGDAYYPQRHTPDGLPQYADDLIVIGDNYSAVCKNHLQVLGKDEFYWVLNTVKFATVKDGGIAPAILTEKALEYLSQSQYESIMKTMIQEQRVFEKNEKLVYNNEYPAL